MPRRPDTGGALGGSQRIGRTRCNEIIAGNWAFEQDGPAKSARLAFGEIGHAPNGALRTGPLAILTYEQVWNNYAGRV